MKASQIAIDFIKSQESYSPKAYPDPGTGAEPWTIGFGSTMHRNGSKVKPGETIDLVGALDLLHWEIDRKTAVMNSLIKVPLTQNQFDALTSFVYNCGVGAFEKSTLLKKINLNPNDPTIKDEFLKWTKAGGKTLLGLKIRRQKEAQLYEANQ